VPVAESAAPELIPHPGGQSLQSGALSIKSLPSKNIRLDEDHSAVITTSAENGAFLCAVITSHSTTSDDAFSLHTTVYNSFINAILKTLHLVIQTYGQNPEFLRLEISPMSTGVTATIVSNSTPPAIPHVFPKPAYFHESYPGAMTVELGQLAPNFKELALIASILSTQIQAASARRASVETRLMETLPRRKVNQLPEEVLAELHDAFFHAAVNFFGYRQGYRFSNNPLPIPCTNSDSASSSVNSTHQLEKALGTIKGCRGVYMFGTQNIPENGLENTSSGSTSTSVQVMIRGDLSQGMHVLEESVEHITQSLLKRHRRASLKALAPLDLTHVHDLLHLVCTRGFPSVTDSEPSVTEIIGARWELVDGSVARLLMDEGEVAAVRAYGNGTDGSPRIVDLSLAAERYFVWLLRI